MLLTGSSFSIGVINVQINRKERAAVYIRRTVKVILLFLALFWLAFALLSGSEGYGGGIRGILRNSPNALPWVLLLALVYLAWKWELIGGILIVLIGVASVFFFGALDLPFILVIVSLPLVLLGGALVLSWYLAKSSG